MTSFKNFLQEAAQGPKPKYSPVEIKEAINLLNKHCKDALWMLEENHPIFRGDKSLSRASKSDFLTVDPSLTKRKSHNTANYYTVIFDNHPDMKDWPKRSTSFIATFDEYKAYGYTGGTGRMFVLIPYDGVKIGCVNRKDMWDTRIKIGNRKSEIFDFNWDFRNLGMADTWASINNFQKKLNDGENKELHLLKSYFPTVKPEKFLDTLIDAYSPANTKFTCHTTSTMPHTQTGEVWIGGPCVLIGEAMWNNLVKTYKELNK